MTESRRPRRRIAGERRPGAGAAATVRPATTSDPSSRQPRPAEAQVAVLTRQIALTDEENARADTDGEQATSSPRATGVRLLSSRVLVALAGLLVALLAYDLIFWAKLDQSQAQVQEHRASASAAVTDAPAQAERAAEQILAYRYDRLQADADAAKDFMTDGYAQGYQDTVDDLLAAPASQVKAQVTATVNESGVARVAPAEVDVLLFVNQTSTTTLEPEPQTALNRVVLTMVEQGGRWLVDEITAL
ncbi:MAG: hypothetical protein ACRDO2_12260 [Nocardioidaceae bacterium]